MSMTFCPTKPIHPDVYILFLAPFSPSLCFRSFYVAQFTVTASKFVKITYENVVLFHHSSVRHPLADRILDYMDSLRICVRRIGFDCDASFYTDASILLAERESILQSASNYELKFML